VKKPNIMKNFVENYFYLPEINPDESLILSSEESHHISKVLRLQTGDKISITNGKGDLFEASIKNVKPYKVICDKPTWVKSKHRPPPISLAIGTLKPKQMEIVVENCVPQGLNNIIPLICSSNPNEIKFYKSKVIKRMADKCITALKQSKNVWLSNINDPLKFESLLERCPGQSILCQEGPDLPTIGDTVSKWDLGKKSLIIIGPAQGFNEKEIAAAKEKDVAVVRLGFLRLRSELAASVALAGIQRSS
jgi:16S rRNA (uracil1498-N3)-methyltransferase